MSVATVIVNYNAGETLQQCVSALLESEVHTKIVLVDNASSDGSAEQLHGQYGDRENIDFLFNTTNPGFAPAINTAVRHLDVEWVLILNPDCILEVETLGRLKHALENDTGAALAGPAVFDENGGLQRATVRRFPGPWRSLMTACGLWRLGKWFPVFHGIEVDVPKTASDSFACDAVSGACMLIRRSALEEVGLFDEAYYLHCEDLDLMYRLRERGWHCLYVPSAHCIHKQGTSSKSRPGWVHFQKHRGMARFFGKFQARSTFLPMRLLVYTGIWIRFLISWPLVMIRR